jgi:hypothetical protein
MPDFAREIATLRSLEAIYGPGADALRITETGIWHPTPLSVLAAAVDVCAREDLIRRNDRVFDAGAGDGRVLAACALRFPASSLRLHGLEIDRELVMLAQRRLSRALPRVTIAVGDYFADDGGPLGECDVVFNYPDGNERDLVIWFLTNARDGARLLVLSPEARPDLGAAPVARLAVSPSGSPVLWSLVLFSR